MFQVKTNMVGYHSSVRLHYASWHAVWFFITFVPLVHVQDGQTALFVSSYKGHDQIVELLLRREADVNYHTKVRLLILFFFLCFFLWITYWYILILHVMNLWPAEEDLVASCCKSAWFTFRGLHNTSVVIGSTVISIWNNSFHTQYGTPLTIARSKGHEKIVQLLLEANKQR